MIEGAANGFEKKLEIVGVGYRADVGTVEGFKKPTKRRSLRLKIRKNKHDAELMMEYALGMLGKLSGKVIELQLGFSHPIFLQLPEDIQVGIEKKHH